MRRILIVLALACAGPGVASESCEHGQVLLKGPWGETRFSVEIADDPEERSKGLMFRESMPRGAGMLFVYETPQRAAFWMKNTLIPLDMLFLDATGTVTSVHHDAIPGDLTAIEGGEKVFAVLEINAGLARRYGIGAGSVMRHPVFSNGPAAWPC